MTGRKSEILRVIHKMKRDTKEIYVKVWSEATNAAVLRGMEDTK